MEESGEVVELYRSVSKRLEEIVRIEVRHVSTLAVEDACQYAWDQLFRHRARVKRDTALAWLALTAIREARRLRGWEDRFLSLDAVFELAGDAAVMGEVAPAHEVVERRERIRSIGALPERQRRLVWLRALGFDYEEMAAQAGSTTRAVERQLLRANRRLREVAA